MPAIKNSVDQSLKHERLLSLLEYDCESGVFTSRRESGRLRIGDVVGTKHPSGYLQARVDYGRYLLHRLAWFYVHGVWPEGEIDHIDGNKANNRISNLRVVTRQQNRWNAPLQARKGGILRNIRFKDRKVQVMFSTGRKRDFHKSFSTLCAAVKERNRIFSQRYGEYGRACTKEARN